ncbi:peptidoglycan-binding domain-containing protein [Aquabacterium humicola]|uniref:peptidoglycan-binding domain-containing protein n=1 Tax=Aquabacterium humicola TaxID=3237377 RepID=UPI002542A021|nr:peptidoglycan-binding domain-containing protein [Rubrivivax pictus]
MDSRVIDVAIGLALVFALVSLLVTALQEVYSSSTGLRGKVLRQAIASFVGDDDTFATALMGHPLLAALSPQKQEAHDDRRPSYIKADAIVAALLGHLVDTHAAGVRPETPLQLIEALRAALTGPAPAVAPQVNATGLANAGAVRPNALFVRGLSSLVMGVEKDWPAFEARLAAWYDAVGERSTGWFKRKTQAGVFTIGLLVAIAANINPIVIASRLWTDEPLRHAVVKAAERASETYAANQASGGATAADRLLAPAAGPASAAASPTRPPTPAPTGPAGTATAADVEAAVHGVWSAMNGISTTADARLKPLFNDVLTLDKAIGAWRAAGGRADDPAVRALQNRVAAVAAKLPPEVAPKQLIDRFAELSASVARVLDPGKQEKAAPVPRRLSAVCAGPEAPRDADWKALCGTIQDLGTLQQLGLPIGWTGSAQPTMFTDPCPADRKGTECDRAQRQWADWALMPVGWLIVALACTLGAPFWFDALSKLVRLRGSGGRPEASPPAGDSAKSAGQGLLTPPAPPAGMTGSGTGAGGAPEAMSDALNDSERALTTAEVQRVQRGIGMQEIEVSGWFDGPTRRAIKAWQEARGLLPATGELSAFQIGELQAMRSAPGSDNTAAAPAPPAPAPPGAPAHDDEHGEGCGCPVDDATPDEHLPAARGGVDET